jgi:hypothetical protein
MQAWEVLCSGEFCPLQLATRANLKTLRDVMPSSGDKITPYSRKSFPITTKELLTIRYSKEDPLIPFSQWQLGNPCPVPSSGNTTNALFQCNIASFPAYVVNASTVKDVQLAINFARNNHIRLTIKYARCNIWRIRR